MDKRLRALVVAAALLAPAGVFAEDTKAPAEDAAKKDLEVGTGVGQKIPQVKADVWDLSGEEPVKSAFDSHATEKPTAYVFVSGACPWCVKYQERIAAAVKTYGGKGIRFVMVYPMTKEPNAGKRAWHKKSGFEAPLLDDADASIARKLGVTKTPEVILTSKEGEILFRGGIDDSPTDASKVKSPYFANACDDLLADRKVAVTTAPMYG
ncbi:MAG TPA: redoxin family protein [Planctomycetota bacterium]|nr:redoxin family protein [Planctomycetota bacterium]